VQRYRQRISGPLLDRIDLHIEVPAVEYRDISSTRAEEGSAAIRDRVGRARERQRERFRADKKINCNARMGPRQIKQHCKLSDESQELIRVAMTELNLSARAYDRILKVSREPLARGQIRVFLVIQCDARQKFVSIFGSDPGPP
jgi:magnesium chelatase family protein